MSFTAKGPNITVAAAATTSNHIYADKNYEGSKCGLMLHSPAVLAEAGTIQVTDGVESTDATNVWRTLQLNSDIAAGADLPIPAAGKSRLYKDLSHANGFRIVLGGAAGAQRVFNTSLVFET
jgi:hypothetical protein